MNNAIIESGMSFITDNTFHIEKSTAYTALGEGIKSVEFVRRKDKALMFVEAKATFANPSNNGQNFDDETNEITDKFIHSLNLYAAIAMGLYPDDITPTQNLPSKTISLKLVLVIRDHKIGWCRFVKKKLDLLLNQCTYLREIWRPEVYVINVTQAIQLGLVKTVDAYPQ